MVTIYDKKVLRAHGFYDPASTVTQGEIENALQEAKKVLEKSNNDSNNENMPPRILKSSHISILENLYNQNGGIDNVTQEILAKQLKKPKRKIQVRNYTLYDTMKCL